MNNRLSYQTTFSKCILGKNTEIEPELSIVIPTYKRIDTLRKLLASILSFQKVDLSYEVIIVSNDPDFDINIIDLPLDELVFRIYVNKENIGMCANMNQCLKLSKGRYIAYIQDDDVLLSDFLVKLNSQLPKIARDNISCLIPNRLFLMDENSNNGFGKTAKRNMIIKNILLHKFRFPKKVKRFNSYDCFFNTFPIFGGGPTCGIVFRKKDIFDFGGFDESYPFAFDYVFFNEFALKYNVSLWNYYSGIYVTYSSASNKDNVQYDFFRARFDLLNKYKEKNAMLNKYYDCIIYKTYINYPISVRKLIDKEYKINNVRRTQYLLYRLLSTVSLYICGGYRRKYCPTKIEKWYKEL